MGATELILVRHGESAGNVAATAAMTAGAEVIEVDRRDADVPLSPLGEAQAAAFGRWLADLPVDRRPDAVWSSPYLRAQQTARIGLDTAVGGNGGWAVPPVRVDERLRDRELGILDLLTPLGVQRRFPEEAARRRWLGKFYHRPPGGESWADVALRLRSGLLDLDIVEDGRRVLVVAHDAVVLLIRYICEGMTEQDVLGIASTVSVRNASVTRLVRDPATGYWECMDFNLVEHLAEEGVPSTEHAGDANARPQ
jgi:broad specificity phosphatase PhoE